MGMKILVTLLGLALLIVAQVRTAERLNEVAQLIQDPHTQYVWQDIRSGWD
jgi:hypothetical protein